MKTSHIAGTEPRADDAQLTKKLMKCAFDGGGNTMRIGIRNETGRIYRSVEAVGLKEFMDVVECLQTLHFTDELEDECEMKDGFDAIFSSK